MVLNSVEVLVEALRDANLLRADQLNQIVSKIAPQFTDTQEFARHLVKLGWITLYQAKKLINGHGTELSLGHYVILEKIGEGGMGKVYKAKQLRLNRVVALKVIRPNLLTNETALKRFHREAKSAAQLAHPNIVRLFDADQVGDRHFLAMEYVEGFDLAHLVKDSGPLPIGMACSFIRQAAIGLQHAHDLGLVHRDIKPSNLLVTSQKNARQTGSGGVVKILDMGLARVIDSEAGDSEVTALTQAGTVIGTPDFMSPEQAKNSSSVDARSDLYSLGCTLYYLLTAQTLFPRGTTLEKLLKHQMDPPPHIQLQRPDVPDELANILLTLLAKRPEDRFQSGMAVATALEPWSVFDPHHRSLKTSNASDEREDPIPQALPVGSEVTDSPSASRTPADPFDFDHFQDATSSLPMPKVEPLPDDTPPSRKVWWIATSVGGLMLLIVGILLARGLFKKSESPSSGTLVKEELLNPITKKDPPIPFKKIEVESLDGNLPADTQIVAVLNVQQMSRSKFIQDEILAVNGDARETFMAFAKFDPFKSIDRIILTIPKPGPSHSMMIVQGTDFLTPEFINWIGNQPGVEIEAEKIGSVMKDVYRIVPKDREKEEAVYATVLSHRPSVVVVSPNKERILDLLRRIDRGIEVKFEDITLKSMLAKYGQKSPTQPSQSPPTLWVCAGAQTKLLGLGTPKDSGVYGVIATLRILEGMDFEVMIEANSRQEGIAAWGKIGTFARSLRGLKPDDKRLENVVSLFVQASPVKVPGPKGSNNPIIVWSHYVRAELMAEWFAPFLGNEPVVPEMK